MIVAQTRKYTKSLNVVRREGVNGAKLETLIRIEVVPTERRRMKSGGLWSKPRMRCNGISSG
jgi:hypothetical protein